MRESNLGSIATAAISAVIVLFVGAGVYFLLYEPRMPLTLDDETEVERIVSELGSRMKAVSLLAPPPILGATIEEQYSDLVATSTRASWTNAPLEAPGSLVSSPWPDRIEIASSTALDGTYVVDARVVEVTSTVALEGGQSGSYPVRITLERQNGRWLVTGYERLPIADVANRINVTGTYVCLPRRDEAEPQTLECTFGLRTDAGRYYGLDLSILATGEPATFNEDARVRVAGTLVPITAAQDPGWDRYPVQGIILVSSAEEL